jgi:hypothetical protein
MIQIHWMKRFQFKSPKPKFKKVANKFDHLPLLFKTVLYVIFE